MSATKKGKVGRKSQRILPLPPSKPPPRRSRPEPKPELNLYGPLSSELDRIHSRAIQLGLNESDSITNMQLPPLTRRRADTDMAKAFSDYSHDYDNQIVHNIPRGKKRTRNNIESMDTRKPYTSQYDIDEFGYVHDLRNIRNREIKEGMSNLKHNELIDEIDPIDIDADGIINERELALSRKSDSKITTTVEKNSHLLDLYRRDPNLFNRIVKPRRIPVKSAYYRRNQLPLVQQAIDSYYYSVDLLHPSAPQ